MSLLSEFREDMRLARLNNPGYSALFRLIDIVTGLLKLLVLAAFGLGIWHIIYGINVADSKKNISQFTAALKKPSVPVIDPSPDNAELTPERTEMLRQFAKISRKNGAATNPDVTAVASSPDAVIVNPVPSPDAIVEQNNAPPDSSDQIVATVQPDPSLDLQSGEVFEALEKRLLPAAARSADATASLPQAPSVVTEPITTEQILVDSPMVADTTGRQSPPVELQAGKAETPNVRGGELNEEKWLLAQNAEHYVIQIGSTTNRPFLVRFARLLPDSQPKAIFHYIFNEKPEYGLSFGLFETKAQANAALEQLSQKARRYGAFSRKISIIHKQIDELADKVAFAQK